MAFSKKIAEIHTGAPRVTVRPAAALGAIGNHNLFTVTDLVLVQFLVGEVIDDLAVAATTIGLQVVNTDRVTTTALDTAALNVSGEPAGTLWQVPDAVGQPIRAVDVTPPVANYTLGLLIGALGLVCATGTIQLAVGGANNLTGSARWYCIWIPLIPTAKVVAA